MDYSFNISVAERYDVNSAIIIQHLYFWIRKNKANGVHCYDGRYWTYNSVAAFKELFSFWTSKQVRRILENLAENGAIITGNFNKKPLDRTIWYSLSDEIMEFYESGKPLKNAVNKTVKINKNQEITIFDPTESLDVIEQIEPACDKSKVEEKGEKPPICPNGQMGKKDTQSPICPNGQMHLPKWANGYLYTDIKHTDTKLKEDNIITPLPPLRNEELKEEKTKSDDLMQKTQSPSIGNVIEQENKVSVAEKPSGLNSPKAKKLLNLLNESGLPEEVIDELAVWLKYKKYKYEEIGLKSLLTQSRKAINAGGIDRFIEIVEESMSNNYLGITWNKAYRGKGAKRSVFDIIDTL